MLDRTRREDEERRRKENLSTEKTSNATSSRGRFGIVPSARNSEPKGGRISFYTVRRQNTSI